MTRVREADLQRHLENNMAKDQAGQPRVRQTPSANAEPAKPTEMGSKEDFQLSQAIAFLKGEPVKAVSPTVAQSDQKPTKPAAN
jgi:carboxyl-terminal processing protease